MPHVSLKEAEREVLFNLVCDSIVYLNDRLAEIQDESEHHLTETDEDVAAILREAIERRDALAAKLARPERALPSSDSSRVVVEGE
jgi:hypothetical protein